jgi:hypothetical protein
MTRARKLTLIGAAVPAILLALFFATARYGDDPFGNHYIKRSPIADIQWGPKERFIVKQGVNVVADPGKGIGAPGNVVEFPISGRTRVSVRLVSVHWIHDAFIGWESNHPRVRDWIDPCPPRADCPASAAPGDRSAGEKGKSP